ncbi:nuclear RNA export factor 1-like [Oratosquilla oratoria]|uniref:nuclear RNA export factor 1-like n=1 Tax=Oratosquilla oratoria TaxID=337810 RepID=UPI003F76E6FB
MGRKRRKRNVQAGGSEGFEPVDEMMALEIDKSKRYDAKTRSKMKKLRKKSRKDHKSHHNREPGQKSEETKYKGWHQVRVMNAETLSKTFLLETIGNYMETSFQVLGFHKIGNSSSFYLEDNHEAADAIQQLNNRLPGPDSQMLKIVVKKCGTPDILLNLEQLQVLKNVMAQRYDVVKNLLDLTSFHHDNTLVNNDIFAPLCSAPIMKQVLRIIREIPVLKALSLSRNRLRNGDLKVLNSLQTASKQLTALNLEHNEISDISVLKYIKTFPLEELSLQHNKVVNNFKEPLKYIEIVRKDLPLLKILDEVNIVQYLAENGEQVVKNMPGPSNHLPSTSVEGKDHPNQNLSESLLRTFLDQYYGVIDTENRGALIAAYTPEAVLSLQSKIDQVSSQVFHTQSNIAKLLQTFPATKHIHETFSLNVISLNKEEAKVQVKGKCMLAGHEKCVAFSRTMFIVTYGAGLCCREEILEIQPQS